MAGSEAVSPLKIADLLGKEPPFSEIAEQQVISSILVDSENISVALGKGVKEEYFYNKTFRGIFAAAYSLYLMSKKADVVTIAEEAVRRGVFESETMAKDLVLKLFNQHISDGNFDEHCAILEQKYYVRTLINVAYSIIEEANEHSVDVHKLIDHAEQMIYDIRKDRVSDGVVPFERAVFELWEHLKELSGPDAEKHKGTRMGFKLLDHITTGLNSTDLLILAARPAMGKSAFALNIAVNACRSSGKQVVVFSLEMSNEQIASRILSSEAFVNNSLLRTGKLSPEDWTHLAGATDRLENMQLYLDQSPGLTVPAMKAKLRRFNNLGLVVIDYLQLMSSPNNHTSRVTEVSEITRQLKLMAKELDVPVLALSQLSRKAEDRPDKRPMLSDLRESGSIEQDADIIMFLYRDAYYDKNSPDQSIAECLVAKNRHGQTDTVKLVWRGEYQLFSDQDNRHEE